MEQPRILINSYDYEGLISSYLQQDRNEASTAGKRMSYEGKYLYSYQANIAILENNILLINDDYWKCSRTTSRHFRILLSKTHLKYFRVSFSASIEKRVELYIEHITEYIKKFTRTRSLSIKASYKTEIKTIYEEALAYADYIKLDKRTKLYKQLKIKLIQTMLRHKLLGD